MLNPSRLSIWDGEIAMDNWYSATSGQKPRTGAFFDTETAENGDYFCHSNGHIFDYPDDAANEWFYNRTDLRSEPSTSLEVEAGIASDPNDSEIAVPVFDAKRMTLKKPLPYQSPPPYFEYLFANAALERSEYEAELHGRADSEPCLSISVNDPSSPKVTGPSTPLSTSLAPTYPGFDCSAFSQYYFHQAGIPVTTYELIEHHLAAAGTGLASNLTLAASEEVEKADASAGFYGGFPVEESPSPYHAPLVDGNSGFGDIREGAEEFPEQWTFNEKRPTSYTIAEADAMMYDLTHGDSVTPSKCILKLRPQKAKPGQQKSCRLSSAVLVDDNAEVKHVQVISKKPDYSGAISKVRKRAARDSFPTRSTYNTSSGSDDEVQYLYTKKIRMTPEKSIEHVIVRPAYSLISEFDNDYFVPGSGSSVSANKIFSGPNPALPVLKGYPGQFRGLGVEETLYQVDMSTSAALFGKKRLTMGDCLHPNYLYTHTNFRACTDVDKVDYTNNTAPPNSNTTIAIHHAYDMATAAGEVERTQVEDMFRREIHLECTSARLEGVAVGQYRYYQGHLNVEEYKIAGICICWDVCACSKMCTRFGDLICPCSAHIDLHEH